MDETLAALQAAYDDIVRLLSADPQVTTSIDPLKKRFGRSGELKYRGAMFAFQAKGRLIVKLPQPRVRELIDSGQGEPCAMGKGRAMREWVVVPGAYQADWPSLAREALAFVAGE